MAALLGLSRFDTPRTGLAHAHFVRIVQAVPRPVP